MRSVKLLVLILLLALVPAAASAADYVFLAPNWGAKQTAAVQMAGGIVLSSHAKSGIGVATSSAPDFLSRALASKAFQYGAADQIVEWTPQEPVQQAVNTGDDRFFPIQWNMQSIEAPAAWAAGCTGQGVRVAVIDGGIFDAHQDLAGAIDTACSTSFVAGQPFNNDGGTFWHGTHVAGIVAARDNNVGTVGVAPDATIIGVKALHNGSGSFAAVINAILYAADPAAFGAGCARADIINMSLGAVFNKNASGAGPLIGALNQAVNFAASQGVLVLSAAGNDAIDFGQAFNLVDVPGDSGSGLAVSATGPLGFALGATDFRRPASYSSYGEGYVTVAGPGGDFVLPGSAICTLTTNAAPITNFCWVFDLVLAPCRGTTTNNYCFAAGTSMATPAAAGVAALIKGRFPNISLGALKARLLQSADDEGPIGTDEFYGQGYVNARRACTQ
jgi:subtilisin family serine protease